MGDTHRASIQGELHSACYRTSNYFNPKSYLSLNLVHHYSVFFNKLCLDNQILCRTIRNQVRMLSLRLKEIIDLDFSK